MQLALEQACLAAAEGEVPVGAVVVKDGKVIATGRNAPILTHDPTAHAEIQALRAAARVLGNYRLDGCSLYVTLEPCAMCSGAILHARLDCVVYGATDSKTGAAGSVINLFRQQSLNHRTQVVGGVLAAPCAALLQSFFRARREDFARLRQSAQLLVREDAVRTPQEHFANLHDFPWQPHYLAHLPSLAGWRMHYVDEGPRDAALTYLCLHDHSAWSYQFRKVIPVFADAGCRVVAPDLIGFGKSDKPKKEAKHSFVMHRRVLLELIEELDLKHIILVAQDWGLLLGLTLPMEAPERYQGLLFRKPAPCQVYHPRSTSVAPTPDAHKKKHGNDMAQWFASCNPGLSTHECNAYAAPFPDAGHRAAMRALHCLAPDSADEKNATILHQARAFWLNQWDDRTLMVSHPMEHTFGAQATDALRGIITSSTVLLHLDAPVYEHEICVAKAALDYFRL